MAKSNEQPVIQIDDGESNRLHVVWSRSGKHLIVSIARGGEWDGAGQVELTPAQVEELRDFLAQRPSSADLCAQATCS